MRIRFVVPAFFVIASLVVPSVARADLWVNAKNQVFKIYPRACQARNKQRTVLSCDDAMHPTRGAIYMGMEYGRPGCVLSIERENYKPFKWRWHAVVHNDFGICSMHWQNDNTIDVTLHGPSK